MESKKILLNNIKNFYFNNLINLYFVSCNYHVIHALKIYLAKILTFENFNDILITLKSFLGFAEQSLSFKKQNETPGCVYERRLKIYGYN